MTLEEFIEGAKDHEDIMDTLKKIMDLTPVLSIIVEGRNGWGPNADKDYGNILIKYRTIRIITCCHPSNGNRDLFHPSIFSKSPDFLLLHSGRGKSCLWTWGRCTVGVKFLRLKTKFTSEDFDDSVSLKPPSSASAKKKNHPCQKKHPRPPDQRFKPSEAQPQL